MNVHGIISQFRFVLLYFFHFELAQFGNIIFQNGSITTIGFFLASRLYCTKESTYCVKYADGLLHNVLIFEILIVLCACLAILGYWRAKAIHKMEQEAQIVGARQIEDIVL